MCELPNILLGIEPVLLERASEVPVFMTRLSVWGIPLYHCPWAEDGKLTFLPNNANPTFWAGHQLGEIPSGLFGLPVCPWNLTLWVSWSKGNQDPNVLNMLCLGYSFCPTSVGWWRNRAPDIVVLAEIQLQPYGT